MRVCLSCESEIPYDYPYEFCSNYCYNIFVNGED